MQWPENHPFLLVIVGPTAVGKTAASLTLAQELNGEIVSADSRLFYRGMDIGTAKPSKEEMKMVPHHLVDVAEPDETWSLALFQRAARAVIADIQGRGRLPVLVGGTGQYVQAVVDAWDIPEQQPDFTLRTCLETWGARLGAAEFHRRLARIDPEAASHIEPNNLRRTVRALEVMLKSGRLFSEQRRKGESPYRVCMLGLTRSREELYRRIDERIEQMLAQGLLEETRGLLARGYAPDLPAMSAIGYREMCAVVAGTMTLDEAVMLMKRGTRQFVRRQANWFKLSDADIHWFELSQASVEDMIPTIVQTFSF